MRWIPSRTKGGESLRQHDDQLLFVLTLIIGGTVGLVVVAFILVTENLGARMYPAGGSPWRRLAIPIAGALITGPLLKRYFPGARGSGIPQTRAALFLHGGIIRFRTVLGKFGCSSVSLASGMALGREGPSVQVGAGIASTLGRWLGIAPERVAGLVPIGSAAALAAAFNTPIAAVLFTLEEVMGDMHAPVLGSIVLSSATSWMVLHLILGDEPLFHVPAYRLVHPAEFAVYAVLGVAGGLVSVAFVKLLLWLRGRFQAMPASTQWFQPVFGGLVVGVLGWFVPEVLGVGYGHVSQALNGQMVLRTMALLVGLKVLATASCYASGNAGGIFGPSLFIGAMIGGAVGGTAHHLFPDYTGSVGAYALVGMGTAFAGIVRVPLTSVIMIFEITRDYSIIVPLMISNMMSYLISARLQREPIYEALQHQDGVHLPKGARERQGLLVVGSGARAAVETFSAEETVRAAAARAREQEAWPVLEHGRLVGMISAVSLAEAMRQGRGDESLATVVSPDFAYIHADDPLDTAMRRMAASGLSVLPVVSRSDLRELRGVISLRDVLAAYGLEKDQATVSEVARKEDEPKPRAYRALVAALVLALVLTTLLSYLYRRERSARADQAFDRGMQLDRAGRHDEAIDQFRAALSIGHSPRQRLALAEALLAAGRLSEARIYFGEVARGDPGSGPAHLGLARVAAAEKDSQQALAEYHRAVLGAWPPGGGDQRARVRLELIGMLDREGKTRQAQAELLALASELPPSSLLAPETGRLLLRLHSPRQAVEVFAGILKQNKDDAGAWAGMGEGQLAQGDLAAAQEAFRQAARLDPHNTEFARRLSVVERAMQLDPALRGLASAERYRRSRNLLEASLGAMDLCVAGSEEADAARRSLGQQSRARPRSLADATEANVETAAHLWQERTSRCGPPGPADEALSRAVTLAAR